MDDEIILMHGDLVFENEVFDRVAASTVSCMTVSSARPLPEKDFKAQPLYHIKRDDWEVWLNKIIEFCENDNRNVYAENALNELNGTADIHALDVQNLLCSEIDNIEDLVC